MLVPGLSVRRSTLRLLLLVSFYSTFILLGAAIFSAIENPEEAERVNDLRKSRSEFLQRHPSVTGKFLAILLHFITVDNWFITVSCCLGNAAYCLFGVEASTG